MTFESVNVVLVQFRESGRCPTPLGIECSAESLQAAEERREENERRGPMTSLLVRNGASLARVPDLLARQGFGLERAFAQTRYTRAEARGGARPYTLITFVLVKGAKTSSRRLAGLLEFFSERRYEYVGVNQGTDQTERPMLTFVAKTVAQAAVELKTVEDAEAASFGVMVRKAVPKDQRVCGDQVPASKPAHEPAPVPKAAQPKKGPRSAATSVSHAKSSPEPTDDPELAKLLAVGWKTDHQKNPQPGKVFLTRIGSGGVRGSFVYERKTMATTA